jgi:56kDa selenium binding protein (SBP56)
MSQLLDPTFYRSPAEAIAAPAEPLAYVAAFDPAGRAKDAMTVIDCDPSSSDYGRVVGWSELPTAGTPPPGGQGGTGERWALTAILSPTRRLPRNER